VRDNSSIVVTAVKIIFSHIQVVSIAASFKLKWPDIAMSLFNNMAAFSRVSSDVLSLDCMLNTDPEVAGGSGRNSSWSPEAAVDLSTWTAITALAPGRENNTESLSVSVMDWPLATPDDVELLADALAVHEEAVLDSQDATTGLASHMP